MSDSAYLALFINFGSANPVFVVFCAIYKFRHLNFVVYGSFLVEWLRSIGKVKIVSSGCGRFSFDCLFIRTFCLTG